MFRFLTDDNFPFDYCYRYFCSEIQHKTLLNQKNHDLNQKQNIPRHSPNTQRNYTNGDK